MVSGTSGANTKRMGVFKMQPDLTAGGKPVFKNSNGMFLYYWPANVDWTVGPDITKNASWVVSTSNTDTLCPQDSSEWQEWDGVSWVKRSISVLAGTFARSLRRAVLRVLAPPVPPS